MAKAHSDAGNELSFGNSRWRPTFPCKSCSSNVQVAAEKLDFSTKLNYFVVNIDMRSKGLTVVRCAIECVKTFVWLFSVSPSRP